MSEKYSMNELLAWIEKQCSLVDGEWGCASSCEDECKGPKDAIIARLRAVNNLENKSLMKLAADLGVSFSAAKILEDHVRAEYDARLRAADRLVSVVKETLNRPTSYVDTRNIDKAIAEYEGKL